MIISWMFAATVLGVIAVVAAMATERALRLLGRQGRGAWLAAAAVTVTWPLLAPFLVPAAAPATVAARVIASGPVTAAVAAVPDPTWFESLRAMLVRLDMPLTVLWALATLALLARAAWSIRVLRRLARAAEAREVDGHAVLVSESAGPAAFGIVRPHILLPSWSLELDAPTRAMVLRHEQEHVAAADPAMLMLAWIGAALMPWNAALWVIARRLRVATELDCDLRVVRRGVDARRYSQLLLLMSQRQGATRFAASIAGSPSTLHQRITAMHAERPRNPRLRAAALAAVALLGTALAASPALAHELAGIRDRLDLMQTPQEPARQTPSRRATTDTSKRAPTTTRRAYTESERRAAEEAAQQERRTDVPTKVPYTTDQRRATEERAQLTRERATEERALLTRERSGTEERARLTRERGATEERAQLTRERGATAERALLTRERAAEERRGAETRVRETDRAASGERRLQERRMAEVQGEVSAVQRREMVRADVTEREALTRQRAEQERAVATAQEGRADSRVRAATTPAAGADPQVAFAPGGSPTLRYPDILHSAGVQGEVVLQVVVNGEGIPVPSTVKVLRKSHDLFEASFRDALPRMRFVPAQVDGRNVRQLVQLVYLFRIEGGARQAPVEVSTDVRTLEVTVSVKPR